MALDDKEHSNEPIDPKLIELKARYEREHTEDNPDLRMDNERTIAFRRVAEVLTEMAAEMGKISPDYTDISCRQIQGDIDRLRRYHEALEKGEMDTRGNLIPADPYRGLYGDERIRLFSLQSINYDPTQKNLAEALLKKIGAKLPAGKTLESLVQEADNEYNQTHGKGGEIQWANDSAHWTFPTSINGVALDVSHFYTGGKTNTDLAFAPQVMQPQETSSKK